MNKKISELNELVTSENTDLIPIVNTSETKKQTKLNFLKEIWNNFANFFTKTEADNRYLPIDTDIPDALADLTDDSAHRLVTDTEKTTWNAKQDLIPYTPENITNKGQSNGYAELDAGGKVPINRLPSTLLVYKGVWDADTNTPTLSSEDTDKRGFVYNVSVAGTQFGIDFSLGDWLIYNNSGIAEKSDNSDDVVSVNGKQGVIILNPDDLDDSASVKKFVSDAQKNNWDLAFSWGNHATAGYALSSALADFWTKDGDITGAKRVFGSKDNYAIGFIVNNSEKFTILPNGNMGNITNPAVRFDIRNGAHGEIAYFLGNTAVNPAGAIYGTNDNEVYLSSAYADCGLAFGINGSTDALYISKDKRIGVNTKNPTAGVHIKGRIENEYLAKYEDTNGDMMLSVRSNVANTESVYAKYGFMSSNDGGGGFDIAGFGTALKGYYMQLYSGAFLRVNDPDDGFAMGIGSTSVSVDPSALLDMQTTIKGFLMPRLTTTQKNSIATPAEGLQVFDTDLNSPFFYDTRWKQMSENYWGTYTPTLTGVSNVASVSAFSCQYKRVGNTVTVSGEIEYTVSAVLAQTLIGISFPIASDVTNSNECGGTAVTKANTTSADSGAIYADTANKRAELDLFDTRGGTSVVAFHFTYQVI